MPGLTRAERDAIDTLRNAGFAVVTFTPEELKRAPADRVEDRLVELGNEVIAQMQVSK